jgi:putative transposase
MKHKLATSESMSKALEALFDGGTDAKDFLGEAIRLGTEFLLQRSLESEVTDFLGRDHYERVPDGEVPQGYRNGYRPRRIRTTNGRLTIQEPRVRQSEETFESRILARIDGIEARLETMALEMYTRGLSTRDIEKTLIDEDGRALLSRSSVSRLSEELFAEYEEFATRDLSGLDVVYLFADGVYEAVRRYTRGQAILCAWAILSEGTKTLVHLEAAASESEASWLNPVRLRNENAG